MTMSSFRASTHRGHLEWVKRMVGYLSKFWQKLHSHAYTRAMVCSFVSFTHYLIY
jgi:hypothetical protein